ncbi:hypothetical protein pdam_00019531 [Pocillopora damicornis]|uniref:G-protein coupled receptors family 1 profile domain-containing protein n=1 Tax=Pocillopora damicornis TaxID=46731 RepID=A0A3M6V2T9_POCDA|nr:hypothetical protein pdam_00019531 [Pocillopora damicornis]
MAIATRFKREQKSVTEFPYSNILQVKLPITPPNHLPPRNIIWMKCGVISTLVKISQTAKFSIRQLVGVFMDRCLAMMQITRELPITDITRLNDMAVARIIVVGEKQAHFQHQGEWLIDVPDIGFKLRNIPGEIPSNQKELVIRTARKVTILMISVVVVFFVSWAPALVVLLILVFGNASRTFGVVLMQHPLLYGISFWLICNNSAFNPLLYFIFIESFRQGLRSVCSRCRVPRFSLQESGQELTRIRPTLDIINKEEGNIELTAYSGYNS